jgi:hypothetical protein
MYNLLLKIGVSLGADVDEFVESAYLDSSYLEELSEYLRMENEESRKRK